MQCTLPGFETPTEEPPCLGDLIGKQLDKLLRHAEAINRELAQMLADLDGPHRSPPESVPTVSKLTANLTMSRFTKVLTPAARATLERATTEGPLLYLPPEKIEHYQEVKSVLEAAGGKWKGGKTQAFVFPSPCGPILFSILENGSAKDEAKEKKVTRQAFYTPDDVAATVAIHAAVEGCLVLEPSAGGGALARACHSQGADQVYGIELDPEAAKALPFPCICADFLKCRPYAPDVPEHYRQVFERIVMNPPFTRKADAKHVLHAFEHWLKPGGILTAIVLDDGHDREDITAQVTATGLRATCSIKERLAPGTFKTSGTNVATLVYQIIKAF